MQWDFDDYPNDYTKIRLGEKILKNRIKKSGELNLKVREVQSVRVT